MNIIIALGSNYQQAVHIHWASQRLTTLLHGIRFSRILWTQDIHGTGVYYMNRLATGSTTLSSDVLIQILKDIETEAGRSENHVTIDLDLMQFGDKYYHKNDWPRPYIQQLIPDIK